jgi:hypothetical protein
MNWVTGGDMYFLEVKVRGRQYRTYNGELFELIDRVMRVAPALNDMGQRVGWHVMELRDMPDSAWNQITDAPILMLHEAKAVAETWWRMR